MAGSFTITKKQNRENNRGDLPTVGKNKDMSSLTAKERKEIRQKEQEKKLKKEKKKGHVLGYEAREKSQDLDVPDASTQDEAVVKPAMSPARLAMMIAVPALALILILFSILLPVYIIPVSTMARVDNPVARVHLSNRMVLDFQVFEDEVPVPATNFIFLARQGYFDGAIIFDIQNGFARFGGFRDNSFFHRERDYNFMSNFRGLNIGSDWAAGRNIFSYRISGSGNLVTNHGIENRYRETGFLSFLPNSATEFQIALRRDADIYAENDNLGARTAMTGRAFAEALNQDTRDNLYQLSRIGDLEQHNGGTRTMPGVAHWRVPYQTITITRIQFFNLNRSRWTPDPDGRLDNNPRKWTDAFNFSYWKDRHNVTVWSTGISAPGSPPRN